MPRRNCEFSSGTLGMRVVARAAFGTSLMSFKVIQKNWSSFAPALTTLKRSGASGFSRALATLAPMSGMITQGRRVATGQADDPEFGGGTVGDRVAGPAGEFELAGDAGQVDEDRRVGVAGAAPDSSRAVHH